MINHVWSVLCSKSVIDKESNNLSLIDTLEQVNLLGVEVGKAALIPLKAELVSLWTRDDFDVPQAGKGRTLVKTPHDEELGRIEFDVNLTENIRLRTRNQMVGIPVKEAGVQFFVIEIQQQDTEDWAEVARIPLDVRFGVENDGKK
jgi:hypothetical protein